MPLIYRRCRIDAIAPGKPRLGGMVDMWGMAQWQMGMLKPAVAVAGDV